MVRSQRAEGINSEIATTDDDGSGVMRVPCDVRSEFEGLPIWFFRKYLPRSAALRDYCISPRLTSWLWHNVRGYDVVHVHGLFSYPATIGAAVARARDVPYLIRPFGQLCTWSLDQSALKKSLFLLTIDGANIRGAKALQFTSEMERREAAEAGFDRSAIVVPHGYDPVPNIDEAPAMLRSKYEVGSDEKIILFLSRVHPKKGLDVLIAALGKLKSHRFRFIIAGQGEIAYEKEVDRLLEVAGIEDRTLKAGFVEGYEKQLLLRGSDVFALTSHSENFGIAVIEALSVGLPVVLTPGVALAETVGRRGGGLVAQMNPDSVADAIRRYLDSGSLRREASSLGKQLAEREFTWKANCAELKAFYLSAQGAGLPPR